MRSERWLTRRAARGDRDAFAVIFRRHQQDLYRYCVAILGDPDDAQDALQNTMVKALRALPGERREITLRPWLYRIAHNEAIELRRRERPTEPLEDAVLPAGASSEQMAAVRDRLRELLADLGRLPVRQRGALVMRELAGFDFEQVGDALETSPAAARQLLYEARRGLREMGDGREMGCGAITAILSAGDGRVTRRRDLRAHLRDCPNCRSFAAEIDDRKQTLAAISPLPAAAAAALLKGAMASAGGAAAGGAAGSVGGSAGVAAGVAAKAGSAATVVKSAVGLVAIVAVGAMAADQARVLHLGGGHGGAPPRAAVGSNAAAGSSAAGGRPVERFRDGGDRRVVIPAPGPPPTRAAAGGRRTTDVADRARVGGAATSGSGGETADATATTPAAGAPLSAGSRRARGADRSASGAGTRHPTHPAHPSRSAHAEHPGHPTHPDQVTGLPSPASAGKPAVAPPAQDSGRGKPAPTASKAPEQPTGSGEAADTAAGDAAAPPDAPPGQAKKAAREVEAER